MKKLSGLFLCVIALTNLVLAEGNVTAEEKELLRPHIKKIKRALPLLEEDLKEYTQEYENFNQKYDATEKKIRAETGFFAKNKLKVKLKYYKVQKNRYFKKKDKMQVQLAIYYCILSVFNEPDIPKSKLEEAKLLKSKIEERKNWAARKRLKSEKNIEKAEKKMREIPKEEEKLEKALKKLEKRMEVLNYKKSWSNMSERVALRSKIAFQKSKILKLQGELVIRQKFKDDAYQEKKAMLLEETEATVALKVIDTL